MGLIGIIHDIALKLPLAGQIRQGLKRLKKPVHRRRLDKYKRSAVAAPDHPRVLVMMNTGIGNAVEATPLVQAIRIHWPKSHITLYAPKGDLFDDWNVPDEITCFPDPLSGRVFDHTFEIWSVDPPIPDSNAYPDKGIEHALPFTGTYWLKPEREYNLDMIRALGFRGPAPPLYVSMKKPGLDRPDSSQLIGLVPGSKNDFMWRHKRWPYFTDLTARLLNEYPKAAIAIIGGPDDLFEPPEPSNERLLDLRGQLTLRETAWVLRRASFAVGNDCGPMHIADAVQTRSLILFGPSCELKNGPLYKAEPLSYPVSCRPCQYEDLLLTCDNPRCMNELTVDLVMARVHPHLQCRQ